MNMYILDKSTLKDDLYNTQQKYIGPFYYVSSFSLF